MKEIKLEEVLFKKLRQLREKHPKENYYTDEMIRKSPEYEYFIGAMKDACQQVLELAAENVKIDCLEFPLDTAPTQSCIQVIQDGCNEREYHIYIEKQSILDVINQVK